MLAHQVCIDMFCIGPSKCLLHVFPHNSYFFHLGSIQKLLEDVTKVVPASRLALHCHDTYGQALSNILTGLKASHTYPGYFMKGLRKALGRDSLSEV